jgi:flagellar biosynthetic protein FliO
MFDDVLNLVEIILVLAIVFWLAWYVTRFIAKRSGAKSAGRFMRVVDRLALGADKALLLVKIGRQYSVIGMSGHEMRLIRTLDETETAAFDAAAAEQTDAQRGGEHPVWNMQSFAERLGFAMKRGAKPRAQQYRSGDEYNEETREAPREKTNDEQSVIDMMNERIKLRKDSKWK